MENNPYSAPQSNPTNPLDDAPIYVGFWLRVWAALIDTFWIGLVTTPLLVAVYGWEYFHSEKVVKGPAELLISYVLPAIAVIIFWRYKSATPGKMVIHAIIVDAKTGQPASSGQLIGRYFGYFVSMLPLMLGLIWVGIDVRKQGFHDKLAGTVVIKQK